MLYPFKQITGFLFHFLMITLPHNAGYQNFVKFVKIEWIFLVLAVWLS